MAPACGSNCRRAGAPAWHCDRKGAQLKCTGTVYPACTHGCALCGCGTWQPRLQRPGKDRGSQAVGTGWLHCLAWCCRSARAVVLLRAEYGVPLRTEYRVPLRTECRVPLRTEYGVPLRAGLIRLPRARQCPMMRLALCCAAPPARTQAHVHTHTHRLLAPPHDQGLHDSRVLHACACAHREHCAPRESTSCVGPGEACKSQAARGASCRLLMVQVASCSWCKSQAAHGASRRLLVVCLHCTVRACAWALPPGRASGCALYGCLHSLRPHPL